MHTSFCCTKCVCLLPRQIKSVEDTDLKCFWAGELFPCNLFTNLSSYTAECRRTWFQECHSQCNWTDASVLPCRPYLVPLCKHKPTYSQNVEFIPIHAQVKWKKKTIWSDSLKKWLRLSVKSDHTQHRSPPGCPLLNLKLTFAVSILESQRYENHPVGFTYLSILDINEALTPPVPLIPRERPRICFFRLRLCLASSIPMDSYLLPWSWDNLRFLTQLQEKIFGKEICNRSFHLNFSSVQYIRNKR